MNLDNTNDRMFNLPFQKKVIRDPNTKKKELRLPLIGSLPNRVRNLVIATLGEFVGTFMFLYFAFAATQVANAAAAGKTQTGDAGGDTQGGGLSQEPNAQVEMYISLAFGFSLAVNAWIFFRITGGLFNPAVTLALALVGGIGWTRAFCVFIAQILGSMAASGVVLALYPGAMNVSTTLGGGTSIVQGLFIEMFLTALLVFTILMLAAEKHKGTFLAPIGIGLALFVAELAGVYFTGGSLNPARSFGPCVALRTFPGYHWIYWLGPVLGSLLAVGFYRFVKLLEYETANPGQDFNEKEAEVFQFDEENAATGADVERPNVGVGLPDYIADQSGVRPTSPSEERVLGSVGSRGSQDPRTSSSAYGYGGPNAGVSAYAPPSSGNTNGNVTRDAYGNVNGNGAGRTFIEQPAATNGNTKVKPTGPDAAYRGGPDAEAGQDLGGNYRVSGL